MAADTETATINLRVLTCPRDGTILEHTCHSTADGRFECPSCNHRWEAYQVTP